MSRWANSGNVFAFFNRQCVLTARLMLPLVLMHAQNPSWISKRRCQERRGDSETVQHTLPLSVCSLDSMLSVLVCLLLTPLWCIIAWRLMEQFQMFRHQIRYILVEGGRSIVVQRKWKSFLLECQQHLKFSGKVVGHGICQKGYVRVGCDAMYVLVNASMERAGGNCRRRIFLSIFRRYARAPSDTPAWPSLNTCSIVWLPFITRAFISWIFCSASAFALWFRWLCRPEVLVKIPFSSLSLAAQVVLIQCKYFTLGRLHEPWTGIPRVQRRCAFSLQIWSEMSSVRY